MRGARRWQVSVRGREGDRNLQDHGRGGRCLGEKGVVVGSIKG